MTTFEPTVASGDVAANPTDSAPTPTAAATAAPTAVAGSGPSAGSGSESPPTSATTSSDSGSPAPQSGTAVELAHRLHARLQEVVYGAPEAITVAVVAALSGGHLLIEDVPGVGKTVLARSIAVSLGSRLSRIQGHPDLLPTDVTGVSVYTSNSGAWQFRHGPIFAHVVLLDELNRTPPRTQSALLESMEERQVTVDGTSWSLPAPHFVVATQNPVGQLGTFPLVESQLDRFALSTPLGYPDPEAEAQLTLRHGGNHALAALKPLCATEDWARAIEETAQIHVDPEIARYAVTICRATREAPTVRLGASPRASITLVRSAQTHALIYGRDYVSPVDIQAMAIPSLAHRLVTSDEPDAGINAVRDVVLATPAPRP